MKTGDEIKKLIAEGKNDTEIVDATGAKLNYVKTMRYKIKKEQQVKETQ